MKERVIKNPEMKVILEQSGNKAVRQDKLNAMRVALTYTELSSDHFTPEEVIEVAGKFYEWLKS